jgi:Kef-type K+ transport system membrane component KefB
MAAVFAAVALAPIVVDHLKRWITVPSVILELCFGILLGPVALNWIDTANVVVTSISSFGLSALLFMAGYEIDFRKIRGGPLKLAILGWLISLGFGLSAGAALRGASTGSFVVGLALTTTALGTFLPIIRDSGLLETSFGPAILAVGAIGEFGPIIAVDLLLDSKQPLRSVVVLVIFTVIAVSAAVMATRPKPARLARLVSETIGTSVQLAVRISVLALMVLIWVADSLQIDVLLGAFAAGIVIRQFLRAGGAPHEIEAVESKLDGIAFGFVVPFFFVVSGSQLALTALFHSPTSIAYIPAFLALFLLVRGVPTFLLNRDRPDRKPLAMFAATALPMVVAITTIGVDDNKIQPSTAAGLVAAAMLSVLIFPQVATSLLKREGEVPRPREPGDEAESATTARSGVT